jgi:quercetin dioxygenase-like cupin family protein
MSHILLRADDPTVETFRGVFFKIRRALGTTAFGINEVRLPAGAEGIEHDEVETGHDEVYLVLEGDGRFRIDGEDVPVATGDYLRVPAGATRKACAGGDGLRFVVVAGKPLAEYDGRASL